MVILDDILLGSNKNASTGWSAVADRHYDITLDNYGTGGWSVAWNVDKVGGRTIGWIVRADGNWGHVAGLLAVTAEPQPQVEPYGTVHYVPGVLFPLPREWWIDGARLNLAGWPRRSPFGVSRHGTRMARFRNGERLVAAATLLMFARLHPVAQAWVENARNGSL